jgi:putative pre-16S rRNA nuclease
MTLNSPESVIAIDFGEKRVGVAIASMAAQIPRPFKTLVNDVNLIMSLRQIVESENVVHIVVGYPRGLEGQSTDQTKIVEEFVKDLEIRFKVPIDLQDEALTSEKAIDELNRAERPYTKEEVDALAAAYILNDWISEHRLQMGMR